MKPTLGYGSVRLQNQKTILNLIRLNRISRMDLASRLNLKRPSITQLVDQLIAYGLVQESETVSTGRGRHPTLLELVPDSRYVIGVNIMRQSIDVGIANLVGVGLIRQLIPSAGLTPEDACAAVAKTIRAQIDALKLKKEQIMGVGICAPGPLDTADGTLINPPNFNAWHGFPVVDEFRRLLGYPALLENVSNALAIEEKYYGVAGSLSDFIAIQINEGIGAGVFVNGELYKGAHDRGTELGHTSIAYQGRPCPCGNLGCLEQYASIPAILSGTPYKTWKQLVDAWPESADIIGQESDYLAAAIVNALNLFDISRVVLLGDVTYRPQALLAALEKSLARRGVNTDEPGASLLQSGLSRSDFRTGAVVYLSHFFEDLAVPLAYADEEDRGNGAL